jgi:hypothetical protein
MDRNVGESQPRRRCFSSNTQDGNGAGGSRQVQHWVEEAERLDELEAERGLTGVEAVSRPFPSWNRSISTEIYLCHACSCQEILRTETAGQVAGIAVASMPAMATANVATGSVVAASGARAHVAERTGSTPKRTITVCAVQDDVGDL